jgi:hypothetical protein
MLATDPRLSGDELLLTVTDAMVALHELIEKAQRLSGRGVGAFISNSHVGPDIEIELFMLTAPTP